MTQNEDLENSHLGQSMENLTKMNEMLRFRLKYTEKENKELKNTITRL